ncbi:MAG TPA: hypothetical protein VFZ59_13175 [Verrucomicrobiae bacterium]|nr:hypothetical protein [Verrucomicrobiae bacterium]
MKLTLVALALLGDGSQTQRLSPWQQQQPLQADWLGVLPQQQRT